VRIRSIKPEFWRSDDITTLDLADRLLFIGLWSYVDDNGVGWDSLAHITADLFAADLVRDSSETFARVSRGLSKLAERGQIVRYKGLTTDEDATSRSLLAIVKWEKHQRIDKPGKARYTPPTREDIASVVVREGVARVSRDGSDIPAPGAVEQWSSGAVEQSSSSEVAIAPSDSKRDDVDRICEHLADRIESNGSKRPTIASSWRREARLLLDKDDRTEDEIHTLIDWCQDDSFWRSNILSLPKLREKFDQLSLKSRTPRPVAARQQETNDMFARAALRAEASDRKAIA
jgi:hypothetical protein